MKPKTCLRDTILLGLVFSIAGCTSTTVLNTVPQGAKVYMDEQYKGVTPLAHKDTKIVGTSSDLRFEKEGYQPLNTVLTRNEKADVGAIVGGVFLLVPFLWTMGYDPEHSYELRPLGMPSTNTVVVPSK